MIRQSCLSYARRTLSSDPAVDAEDLVQSAFLKTLGRLDGTRPVAQQIIYLRRAIDQVALDAGRRRRFVAADPGALPECADPRRDTEGEALAREADDEWAGRLAALDAKCGPAAALVFCAGFSYREASAALGVLPTTLRMRLVRARGHLRAMLLTA